jgi:hypothetical protein
MPGRLAPYCSGTKAINASQAGISVFDSPIPTRRIDRTAPQALSLRLALGAAQTGDGDCLAAKLRRGKAHSRVREAADPAERSGPGACEGDRASSDIGQLQGPPSTVASDQPNFRPIPRPSRGEIGAGIGEGARVTSPRREIRRMGPKQAHTIALRCPDDPHNCGKPRTRANFSEVLQRGPKIAAGSVERGGFEPPEPLQPLGC